MSKYVKANNSVLSLALFLGSVVFALPIILRVIFEIWLYQRWIFLIHLLPVFYSMRNLSLFSKFTKGSAKFNVYRKSILFNFVLLALAIVVSVVYLPVYVIFFVLIGLVSVISLGLALLNPDSYQDELGVSGGLAVFLLLVIYLVGVFFGMLHVLYALQYTLDCCR